MTGLCDCRQATLCFQCLQTVLRHERSCRDCRRSIQAAQRARSSFRVFNLSPRRVAAVTAHRLRASQIADLAAFAITVGDEHVPGPDGTIMAEDGEQYGMRHWVDEDYEEALMDEYYEAHAHHAIGSHDHLSLNVATAGSNDRNRPDAIQIEGTDMPEPAVFRHQGVGRLHAEHTHADTDEVEASTAVIREGIDEAEENYAGMT
jgi:hypothetical protein